MLNYFEWRSTQQKPYELYLGHSSLKTWESKAIDAVSDLVGKATSHLVVKFNCKPSDLGKVKNALKKAGFKVLETEVEDH